MNEIPLKQWLAEEAAREFRSPRAIYDRLMKWKWYAGVTLRYVNKRVVMVTDRRKAVSPNSMTMKAWIIAEAERLNLKPKTIEKRMERQPQKYYPNVQVTRINKRVVFVRENGAEARA